VRASESEVVVFILATSVLLAFGGSDTTSDFDLGEDEFAVEGADDEVGMVDYAEEAKKRPADPTHFHLEPEGKEALKNDYPMQVVAMGPSWVKLELPVLVAADRASFQSSYPHGLRVVTEWDIGGNTTRREQRFLADDVWERAPTLAFFDVAAQDARRSSAVRVKVYAAALPAPPVEPEEGEEAEPVVVPQLKERYAVTSVFYRPKE
jgi:hypothetical protein